MKKCYDCDIEIDVEGEGVQTVPGMDGEFCYECADFIRCESQASVEFEYYAHGDPDPYYDFPDQPIWVP